VWSNVGDETEPDNLTVSILSSDLLAGFSEASSTLRARGLHDVAIFGLWRRSHHETDTHPNRGTGSLPSCLSPETVCKDQDALLAVYHMFRGFCALRVVRIKYLALLVSTEHVVVPNFDEVCSRADCQRKFDLICIHPD